MFGSSYLCMLFNTWFFYLRRKPTGLGTVRVVVVVVVVVVGGGGGGVVVGVVGIQTTFEYRKLCIFQQNGKNKSCRSHRAKQLFLLSNFSVTSRLARNCQKRFDDFC